MLLFPSLALSLVRALSRCQMLGPERPEAVLPDMGLYLPTFSPFLIVNKASLSPLRQLPIAGEYLHVYVCNFLHGFVLSTLGRRRENPREAVCSHTGAVPNHWPRLSTCELIDLIGEKTGADAYVTVNEASHLPRRLR